MKSFTFAIDRQENGEMWLMTVDVDRAEHIHIATFVAEEAVDSFWDVVNLGKMVAQERGRLGI